MAYGPLDGETVPGRAGLRLMLDPKHAARAAHLRYVSDHRPGISRMRRDDGWEFIDTDGSVITDPNNIARIKKLATPPRIMPRCGSAAIHGVICKPWAVMRGAASSTATTPSGARFGMRPSTEGCWCSGACCPPSAPE